MQWKHLLTPELANSAVPSMAHKAIECLRRRFDKLNIITGNHDGLHRKAVELHGNWFVKSSDFVLGKLSFFCLLPVNLNLSKYLELR